MTSATTVKCIDSCSALEDAGSRTKCLSNCSDANGLDEKSDLLQPSKKQLLFYAIATLIIALGMVGIGASVNYKTLWGYLRKPKAFLLGVGMQLLIMPLLAWAMIRMFSMPFGEALGVFIQGCCPGGTVSNIVVYWLDGIVDLSVVMTGTSTLLAMGMMPLWLFIYTKTENLSSEYTVPINRIAISLGLLVIPAAIGVVINAKLPEKAPKISKNLIKAASFFILVMVIANSVLSKIPWVVTWRQVTVAAIMPILAFCFGYIVTLIPGMNVDRKCSRTIAVEVALQNVQIATAIIQVSFTDNVELLVQMLLFPLLYFVFQVGYSAILASLFFIAKKRRFSAEDEQVEDYVQPQGHEHEQPSTDTDTTVNNQPLGIVRTTIASWWRKMRSFTLKKRDESYVLPQEQEQHE